MSTSSSTLRPAVALACLTLSACHLPPDATLLTGPTETLEERLLGTAPGETFVLDEGDYTVSLVVPEGVSLEGAEGAVITITPPEGAAGVICQQGTAGSRAFRNLRIQSAYGIGLHCTGGEILIEGVAVSDTRALDDTEDTHVRQGHGIMVSDAASVELVAVHASDNAGTGLVVSDVESVAIIVPEFVPTPTYDPNAVGIIVPEFLPSPTELQASTFSANAQGGVSIIVPEFSPIPEATPAKADGQAGDDTVLLGGIGVIGNGGFGVRIRGGRATLDQVLISGTTGDGVTDPGQVLPTTGHAITAEGSARLNLRAVTAIGAVGAGLRAHGVSKLHVAGHTHPPRTDTASAGRVTVDWAPANLFSDNGSGGIVLTGTESALIVGMQASGNVSAALYAKDSGLQVIRSLLSASQGRASGLTEGDGAGLLLSSGSTGAVDAESLITANQGAGVLVDDAATLTIGAEVSMNGVGGLWAVGDGAEIHMVEGSWSAQNSLVGAVGCGGASLTITDASVTGTVAMETPVGKVGDGVWSLAGASLTMDTVHLDGHARAAVALEGMGGAGLSLSGLTILDSAYGIALLHGVASDVDGPGPLAVAQACAQCEFDEVDCLGVVDQACLPVYLLPCNPNDVEGCVPISPCGACSANCADGTCCTLDQCDPCPETVECCANEDCAGANDCTEATCNGGSCQLALLDGMPCDDGDPCTTGELCAGGACTGGAPACDDGDVCTDDACSDGDCEYTFNVAPCDDGEPCTLDDVCDDRGACFGTWTDCPDGDDCTFDHCESLVGCKHEALTGTPCDQDGDVCSVDSCLGGFCVFGYVQTCDDGKVCTKDDCDSALGCTHTNKVPGAGCNLAGDANPCTENEQCLDGVCGCELDDFGSCPTLPSGLFNFEPVVCADDTPCTHDFCSLSDGCVFQVLDSVGGCDDGDPCTTDDSCVGGVCVGVAKDCTGDTICELGACHAGSGECVYTAAFDAELGVACDDGDPCTLGDHCDGQECKKDDELECDDGDPCNGEEDCVDFIGCVTEDVPFCGDDHCDSECGEQCDDGNTIEGDGCSPTCQVETACSDITPCDDGDPCTADFCSPLGFCVFVMAIDCTTGG